MTVFGYMRVSTNETRQSFRSQKDALRKAGATTFFADTMSGLKSYKDRPELSAMLDVVTAGDEVVIFALSRATRSLPDLLELVALLEAKGVGLRSISEGVVDTTTPHGKFMVSILGAVAELEAEWTRARVNAGVAAARARGHIGGRRPKLSAEQVALAQRLRAEGQTIIAIGGILGVSRPTVYKALAKAS